MIVFGVQAGVVACLFACRRQDWISGLNPDRVRQI